MHLNHHFQVSLALLSHQDICLIYASNLDFEITYSSSPALMSRSAVYVMH